VPEIDRLVEIAQGAIGERGGGRMTGGGFGGCIVALLPQDRDAIVQATIEAAYRSPNGGGPRVWVCHARDDVALVTRGERAQV